MQNGGDTIAKKEPVIAGLPTPLITDISHSHIYRYKVPNHKKVFKPSNYVRKYLDHKTVAKPIISRNLVLNEYNFSFEEKI